MSSKCKVSISITKSNSCLIQIALLLLAALCCVIEGEGFFLLFTSVLFKQNIFKSVFLTILPNLFLLSKFEIL